MSHSRSDLLVVCQPDNSQSLVHVHLTYVTYAWTEIGRKHNKSVLNILFSLLAVLLALSQLKPCRNRCISSVPHNKKLLIYNQWSVSRHHTLPINFSRPMPSRLRASQNCFAVIKVSKSISGCLMTCFECHQTTWATHTRHDIIVSGQKSTSPT